MFALAAPLLIYTLIPFIGKMVKKLPDRTYMLITLVPFVLFVIDIIQGYIIKGL